MEEKIKIRPTLLAMEPGDTLRFPIIKLKSVRTQASELGMLYERTYSTQTNREDRTVMVTRIN